MSRLVQNAPALAPLKRSPLEALSFLLGRELAAVVVLLPIPLLPLRSFSIIRSIYIGLRGPPLIAEAPWASLLGDVAI